MLNARLRKNLDTPLLLVVVTIICIGISTIFSATATNPGRYYVKQSVFFLIGLAALVGAASFDYNRLARFTRVIYISNIVFLVYVKKFGPVINGARRWIMVGPMQFQPSEFAKIAMIVCLAVYLSQRREKLEELGVFLGSLAYVGVPALLIFWQPDLGTALVLIAIWVGMTYIAGAKAKHILGFFVVALSVFGLMWKFDIVIHDYQKNRLVSFLNPEADRRETGYHVLQSRIAVGSGKVWGKGFRKGTQVQGKFIPENHTDFIFSVIGEEGGFLLSAGLVALYGLLIWRGLTIVARAEDMLGRLIATGVVSMFGFHIVVNIGMTIGIMPVTGVPLPLVSYGGTNLLLNLAAIGLVLGVGMRRHRLLF